MEFEQLEGIKSFAVSASEKDKLAHIEFFINGSESYLCIYSDHDLSKAPEKLRYVHGLLPDGTKISFIQNVLFEARNFYGGSDRKFSVRLRPHFVVIGAKHFNEGDFISKLKFLLYDANSVYHDSDAFGYVSNPEQIIDSILLEDEKILGRSIPRGKYPEIAYFTGKYDIFSTNTEIGNVSASRSVTLPMGKVDGIFIESSIYTSLEFPKPTPLHDAISKLKSLLRFFEIVLGRKQIITDLLFSLSSEEEKFSATRQSHIYWCMHDRIASDDRSFFRDLPINAGVDPQNFSCILTNWLSMDEARKDARERFSNLTIERNRYSIDRIVGSANIFDILPHDAIPPPRPLPAEVITARDNARRIFKALPNSLERQSILGALGRLDKHNLKQKIRHRATFLINAAPSFFSEINIVTDEAVNCRNHYVHGGPSKINYATSSHLIPFLTDTLEFVFSVSEFLESGWMFQEWAERGTSQSHPWGQYLVNYKSQLEDLKQRLGM